MAIQNNYNAPEIGIPGKAARVGSDNPVTPDSLYLEDATGIYPGSVVDLTNGQASLTTDGTAGYGVVMFDSIGFQFNEGESTNYYKADEFVDICTRGQIFVKVSEDVKKGDWLIYDVTESDSVKGARFKKDASPRTTTIRTFMAQENASAGELCVIDIR